MDLSNSLIVQPPIKLAWLAKSRCATMNIINGLARQHANFSMVLPQQSWTHLMWEVLIPQALGLVVAVHIDEVGSVHHNPYPCLILNDKRFAVICTKLHW